MFCLLCNGIKVQRIALLKGQVFLCFIFTQVYFFGYLVLYLNAKCVNIILFSIFNFVTLLNIYELDSVLFIVQWYTSSLQRIALLNGQIFRCFFLPKFTFALEFYFQYLFLYVLILCIIWQAAIY